MELRHIRYFLAVAEELNYSRAARRLFITQPSLSAQVRQLEDEIGARLLDRDTHRVALTEAGRSFRDAGRRILRDAEDSARAARRIAQGEAGQLSIGFVPSLGHGLLPRILRAYRRRYPEIELRLTEMDTTQQIEAIQANRLDVGLVGLGAASEALSDLQLATITEEKLLAALPIDHPLARRSGALRLSMLADERFVLAARQSAPLYNPWIIVLCQQAGFQPRVVQEAGQPVTVLNYVAAGLGVTLLPAQFSRLATVGVRFVSLARPSPVYRYCAAWSARNKPLALTHFVEVAKQATGL